MQQRLCCSVLCNSAYVAGAIRVSVWPSGLDMAAEGYAHLTPLRTPSLVAEASPHLTHSLSCSVTVYPHV
jgi:hypothetical protein